MPRLRLPALTEEAYRGGRLKLKDVNFSKKVAADPDSHRRACALKCEKSGYGIVTQDKHFLKFDAEGNIKIVEALNASDKKDRLRGDLSGEVQSDTLQFTSIKLL